jgi:glycosyltransferase involved in cell wall biosynthesis
LGVWIPEHLPSPDPDAPPQITFVGRQMTRKGGFRLLRIYQERLQGRCLLNLVTNEPVDPSPGVRVFSDIVVGDPRLPKLLVDSAAFVFPSEIDQSPNAVLEAMACGSPVVALRVGALPEMVEDGVSGFIVERDDDAGLLAAIESLLDEPDLAERMGNAGRRRALERYDVRRSASALVTILGEAIERFEAAAR